MLGELAAFLGRFQLRRDLGADEVVAHCWLVGWLAAQWVEIPRARNAQQAGRAHVHGAGGRLILLTLAVSFRLERRE